jgi:hypothetical protein
MRGPGLVKRYGGNLQHHSHVGLKLWLINGYFPCSVARWPDCFAIDFLVFGRIRAGTTLPDFHVCPHGTLKSGACTPIHRNGTSDFDVFKRDDLKALVNLSGKVPREALDRASQGSKT